MIDIVADTQHISWEQATNLNIMEFLNTMCYRIEKDRHTADLQKQELDKAKMKISKRY